MTHEMDLVRHFGDDYDDLGADSEADDAIASWFRRANEQMDWSTQQMLGLGAGQAYAELNFASRLGIPAGNLTLVDRHFSWEARNRKWTAAPEAEWIESGMFTFLSNPKGKKFDIVTTFGLHDVLIRDNIDEFVRLLPNVLRPGALAFIYYFSGLRDRERFLNLTRENGFEPVDGGYYLFSFSGHKETGEEATSQLG